MKVTRRGFIRKAGTLTGLTFLAPALLAEKTHALPKVLILGDSISIGYTPYVKEMLANEADVTRPSENCQGTTNGVQKIDQWLGDTTWDVVHFNFGLHDLKHVDASGKNSDNPEDPQQAEVGQYSKNLEEITARLKRTGAKLIFATTTPFPDQPDGPMRKSEDALRYNRAAIKIMERHGVVINDLYAFVLPRMKAIQIPNNVHFTKEGSAVLAQQVAESIRTVMRA